MPLDTFKTRIPDNVPGKYYVTDQCIDCDLCRETAPANFTRNDVLGSSYVSKQPETVEEENLVLEAVSLCCTSAINTDGDAFDWQAVPSEAAVCPSTRIIARGNRTSCCAHRRPGVLTRLWRWVTGTARDE